MPRNKKKHKVVVRKKSTGRKWFDGKDQNEILSKLQYVWGIDGTDIEAANYAEISIAALNRYLEAFPDIKALRDKLRESIILVSRANVARKIRGQRDADGNVIVEPDVDLAFEYLKRKRRGEFADRTEQTGPDGSPQQVEVVIKDFTAPHEDRDNTTTETEGG